MVISFVCFIGLAGDELYAINFVQFTYLQQKKIKYKRLQYEAF